MIVNKVYRFRIYPTPVQVERLTRWQGALRFLWNLAHEQRLIGLPNKRYPTAFDQINELTACRADAPWLADVPRNVCGQLLVELDRAWQRCFKKLARRPRFKCKGRDVVGICEPHPKIWSLTGDGIVFPKLGAIRTVLHRKVDGTPKTCALTQDGDQWYACITVEQEVEAPVPRTTPVVAIDRGVVNLVADSDGKIVPAARYFNEARRRLARAQRTVSRRTKGSKNRDKAKLKVVRLHRTIRNQRDHVLHTLSTAYAKSHGTVVVENLQIKNMVRANSGLARSILDSGWGGFASMLRYKLAWSGGQLATVPAAYSSQTCASCGHVAAASRKSQAEFACVACGVVEHADLNAAQVLLQRYLAVESTVTGCGGFATGRPVKQQLRVVKRGQRTQGLDSLKDPAFGPG